LEILKEEESNSVSMARLPKLLQRRLPFTFDLHELGYTKLKQFLQTIDSVVIENDGSTNASIVLRIPPQNLSPTSYNKKFSTLNGNNKSTFDHL
jgi:OST-HTH/LOTUS domain